VNQIEVVKDSDTVTVTRRVTLLVAGVPPMEHYLEPPLGKPQFKFIPQRVRVETRNGQWVSVTVDGPRLRMNGEPSKAQKGEQYWTEHTVDKLPCWLYDAIKRQLDRIPVPMSPGSEAGIAI